MPKLVVVVDARRAREGADEFIRQQDRMRDSARRGSEDTRQANVATIDTILNGLDREVERRTAVAEAMKKGTNEARIEQKIQDTINTARSRGIALGDAEIAQIRAKARASQELANIQAETFRRAINDERDDSQAGRAKALKANLMEARGFIGDVGDAFSQVGQTFLGLSDAQTKAAETTIYMTEKGMGLGEVFGPVGAVVGGTTGFIVGLAAAEITAAKAAKDLHDSTIKMHNGFVQLRETWGKTDAIERQYAGIDRIRIALEDLSTINISDITAKIDKLSVNASDTDTMRYEAKIRAMHDIKLLVDDVLADKGGAMTGAADALDRMVSLAQMNAASEDLTIATLQGRYAEAQNNVKEATKAVAEYKEKLREVSAAEQEAVRAAFAEFEKSDKGKDATNKLNAALGGLSDKARLLVPEAIKVGTFFKNAMDSSREANEKLNAAMDKSPWLLKAIGTAAKEAADEITSGGFDTFLRRLTSGEVGEKLKKDQADKDKAIAAAKQRAEAVADLLKTQERNAQNAEKINAAFGSGGVDAAEIEAAVLNKVGDKKLKPEQLAQLRADTAKEIALNKQLAASKKELTDAEAAANKVTADAEAQGKSRATSAAASEEELAQQKELAAALAISTEEYNKQAFILPRLAKLRALGASDAEIEAERARAEAIFRELEGIETIQKARDESSKESAEVEKKTLEDKKQAQIDWESFASSSLDRFGTTLNDQLWEGSQDWEAFFISVGKDLTAMLIKMALMAALKAAVSGGTSLLGSAGAALGAGAIGNLIVGSSFHSGGVVGSGGTAGSFPASLWNGAPSYHGGVDRVLRRDEVPAILQTGERVLSRSEVAAGENKKRAVNLHIYMPADMHDARGFNRNIHQQANSVRRMLDADE